MTDVFDDVKEFHKAFELPIGSRAAFPNAEERVTRIRLLEEEVIEYLKSEMDDDLGNLARELADIIYIVCGTAVSYGIPMKQIWDAVHDANMKKLQAGKPLRRSDGKVLKPEHWQPPQVEYIIESYSK